MKFRIVKRNNKYIPQYKFLLFWRDYSEDPENMFIVAFDTQEEAEEFIENDRDFNTEVVVKVYDK